jgi:very-short-patch-repair endonuclease
MTPPEVFIWQHLRPANNKDFTFRRQVSLLPGIVVDFYCARKKIAFEIDGKIHELKQDSDAIRDRLLNEAGVTVVRISARRVFANPAGVANLIKMICLGEINVQDLD